MTVIVLNVSNKILQKVIYQIVLK